MFCTVGNHAKHPGLFTPSERKKPEGGRRICAECQKKQYRTGREGLEGWHGVEAGGWRCRERGTFAKT